MPFTKTPVAASYQTKQVKLLNTLDKRDANPNKDNDYLNCFVELVQNRSTGDSDYHITKRAGITSFGDALPSNNVRGVHYWEDQAKIFVAVDDDIVVKSAVTGNTITTLNAVFATSSGKVGFTEFYYDSTAVKVVATDGARLVTIDTANVVVTGADPDMPNPHVPSPIFLDGYLFLLKSNSSDVYNSNLNDPLLWTAGDFISAEMFPDVAQDIAKLNNYLVVFGTASIEYFWDSGITSGSPLQRNDTPVKLIGYIGGLAQNGANLFFMGNTTPGQATIYMLEDFKIEEIGTETIRRYLASLSNTPVSACVTSFGGHEFYVLNVGTLTWAYDLKTKLWARWAFGAGTDLELTASFRNNSGDSLSVIYYPGQLTLSEFNTDIYQDLGTSFTFRIVTDKEYFDSYNQKMMARAALWCDRPTANSTLSLSWTDNDYQTYSNPVTIQLNSEIPCVYRLGRFRRRAFKLEYTDNFPLRIERLEVDINMGQN